MPQMNKGVMTTDFRQAAIDDAYTDAKTDFISKWTVEARKEYGSRY